MKFQIFFSLFVYLSIRIISLFHPPFNLYFSTPKLFFTQPSNQQAPRIFQPLSVSVNLPFICICINTCVSCFYILKIHLAVIINVHSSHDYIVDSVGAFIEDYFFVIFFQFYVTNTLGLEFHTFSFKNEFFNVPEKDYFSQELDQYQ